MTPEVSLCASGGRRPPPPPPLARWNGTRNYRVPAASSSHEPRRQGRAGIARLLMGRRAGAPSPSGVATGSRVELTASQVELNCERINREGEAPENHGASGAQGGCGAAPSVPDAICILGCTGVRRTSLTAVVYPSARHGLTVTTRGEFPYGVALINAKARRSHAPHPCSQTTQRRHSFSARDFQPQREALRELAEDMRLVHRTNCPMASPRSRIAASGFFRWRNDFSVSHQSECGRSHDG